MIKNEKQDTIAAIATPAGDGGIAIIRISGSEAVTCVSNLIKDKIEWKNRTVQLVKIDTGAVKDKVIVLYFQAPFSYTGEDVIEIQCHGSYFLAGRIVEGLLEHGCRPAEPGEFTRRAFLNGRIDLTEAEGILDLIGAQSDSAARAAYTAVSGGMYQTVSNLFDRLSKIIAGASVAIDYPEEDITEPAKEELLKGIGQIESQLQELKDSYRDGILLREGVRTAIAGEPNVGKSCLLNRLLGQNRAIVTAQAGTTRDTVEENFLYRGVRFVLIDTAGIRETSDEAERLGIERSRHAVEGADLILAVSEAEQEFIPELPADIPVLFVRNKADLLEHEFIKRTQADNTIDNTIYVSALTGENLTELKERMYECTVGKISGAGVKLGNFRHLSAVKRALESLQRARDSANLSLDCMLSDCNEALRAIGEVTGVKASDEVIREIFAGFCVGK